MRRFLAALLILLSIMTLAQAETEYADGIYRGFYYDGGIEQIAVQFEMREGMFRSIVFRGVKYKDGNYMSEDASDAQKATYRQYREMADHLIGKTPAAIDDLYTPYDFVADGDAVTSATIQSSKLISALWDGLNRRPYKLVDTTKLPAAEPYADGMYRGSYMEDGGEQVSIELTLRENVFVDAHYRALAYKGVDYLAEDAGTGTRQIAGQFEQLLEYLVGKPVSAVNDLYMPGEIAGDTDASTGATLRSPKVISAIWDALGRHVYKIN